MIDSLKDSDVEERYYSNDVTFMTCLMEQNQKIKVSTGKLPTMSRHWSCQRSHVSQDHNYESIETLLQTGKFQFQFIDLSTRSREQQDRNRLLTRSHATRVSKRAKLSKRGEVKDKETVR